mmetsp:Transcript_11842/g.21076  ORF Transcript_11842/g.21076 Transcript_11842/m.21076 type:complete len:251 (-) Transcript_11842:127-879(-)
MRTSVGWVPPVKGCTDTSNRPHSKLKPMSTATSLHNLACVSTSKVPMQHSSLMVLHPFALMAAISGFKPSRTSIKTSSSRADVMPFSYSSKSTSYAGMLGSMNAAFSRFRSTHRCRKGANLLKSLDLRASTHAWCPSEPRMAALWAISLGRTTVRVYSLNASRTVARAYSSSSGAPSLLLIAESSCRSSAPSSASVLLSNTTPASAAFCAPRLPDAPSGSIVISSQPRSPPMPSKADSSLSLSATFSYAF